MKKHIELNNQSSSYTANATYYFGEASRYKTKLHAFISISDCYHTIVLHPNTEFFDDKELKEFKKKFTKLKDFIGDFVDKLPDKMPKEI